MLRHPLSVIPRQLVRPFGLVFVISFAEVKHVLTVTSCSLLIWPEPNIYVRWYTVLYPRVIM